MTALALLFSCIVAAAGLIGLGLHSLSTARWPSTPLPATGTPTVLPSPSPPSPIPPTPTPSRPPPLTPTPVPPAPSPTSTPTPSLTPTPTPSPSPTSTPSTPPMPSIITGLEFAGEWRDSARAVAVQGSTACIGVGSRLVVLDVSNPAAPALQGQVTLPDTVPGPFTPLIHDIVIAGDRAYLGTFGQGLAVVDISDPTAPRVEGFTDFGTVQNHVAVQDAYAYVATSHSTGVVIVDVSAPATPQEVGRYATTEPIDVFVSGPYAYVASKSQWGGLGVVDVSDPARPEYRGGVPDLYATGVFVSGHYAYVVERDLPEIVDNRYGRHSLAVVDVSDPARPQRVGYYRLGYLSEIGLTQPIIAAGPYVFLLAGEMGLRVIDVSDPTRPREAASYPGAVPTREPGVAGDVAVWGPYVYVATGERLLILRLLPASPLSGNPPTGPAPPEGAPPARSGHSHPGASGRRSG